MVNRMSTANNDVHRKALTAMLGVPHPLPTAKDAKSFLAAEQAYNAGKFQQCLDLLATIGK